MDFGKAFTFMFEDPRWTVKLGIGTLVGLASILLSPILIGLVPALMLLGYSLDTGRNVIKRVEHPLPEWEDWGGLFVRGLKLMVAFLVWMLPLIALSIPLAIGAGLSSNNGNASSVSSASMTFGVLLIVCSSCVMMLWGLLVALFAPAIFIRLAATGRLSTAFEIGKLWRLTRENLGNVILSLLLVVVAGLIASVAGSLGLLLLICGVFLTVPAATLWQYLVQAHLFGQIGRDTVTPLE